MAVRERERERENCVNNGGHRTPGTGHCQYMYTDVPHAHARLVDSTNTPKHREGVGRWNRTLPLENSCLFVYVQFFFFSYSYSRLMTFWLKLTHHLIFDWKVIDMIIEQSVFSLLIYRRGSPRPKPDVYANWNLLLLTNGPQLWFIAGALTFVLWFAKGWASHSVRGCASPISIFSMDLYPIKKKLTKKKG